MNAATVVITWMDDRTETYSCHDLRVLNGVLALYPSKYPDTGQPNRHFPLANIRTWTVHRT